MNGSPLVPQFAQLVTNGFASRMGPSLVNAIPLGAGHAFWMPLSGALSVVSDNEIETLASSNIGLVPRDAQDNFTAFLVAVLRNVRDSAPLAAGAQVDAQTAFTAFNNLLAVHTHLHRLYSLTGSDGEYKNAFLNPLVLATCRELASVSVTAASLSTLPIREAGSARGIKDATRQAIEKSLQVSASSMSESELAGLSRSGAPAVGDIMWSLANILWRHYAQRKLHTQATELSKTFSSIQPPEEKRIAARGAVVPQTAVAESYYWRGRLGVVLLEIRGARSWLEKAWKMCPQNAWQQRRALLIRLIPVALLLGRLPHRSVLEQYSLSDEFTPFIHAFRTGNVPAWRRLLSERREWLRARNIWLLWFERGEILVWRNLFRKAKDQTPPAKNRTDYSLALHYQLGSGVSLNRCPTSIFLDVAQAAFAGSGELEDGTLVLEDIIAILSSLIDQSIIMGNVAYSQRQVVFRPAADGFGGFPRVSTVTPRRVEAIA